MKLMEKREWLVQNTAIFARTSRVFLIFRSVENVFEKCFLAYPGMIRYNMCAMKRLVTSLLFLGFFETSGFSSEPKSLPTLAECTHYEHSLPLALMQYPVQAVNPHVDPILWQELTPYFLPADCREKAILDEIFSKRRVLSSVKSMRKAGFNLVTRPEEKILVARHPKLKGYLIKVYLDSMNIQEWYWWRKRIEGVKVIQASIERHGYQGIMKTPKKWIYPLPAEPSPKPEHTRRNFILVVQDIDILHDIYNRSAYKKKMTPQLLDALYTVITENLLIDAVYADNTSFCRDGRLAFIDTEHAQDRTQPVPLSAVGQYLSKEMRAYWEQLIVHGLPH